MNTSLPTIKNVYSKHDFMPKSIKNMDKAKNSHQITPKANEI